MPLINCKIDLKLEQTKHFALAAAGNNNTDANPNNIMFTIKNTKLYAPVVTLLARNNRKLSKTSQ